MAFFYFLSLNSFAASPSQIEQLQKTADELNLDHEMTWLNLLDYKKTLMGSYKSQAVGPRFFLAPQGRFSPHDELMADIEKIFSDQNINDQQARCRFPARAFYLAGKLKVKVPNETLCPEFTKFKSSFKAESVSLVFSSYYVNNPSSTFGHTFLRFNQHRMLQSQDTDLTDLSVNFGATPWSKNPLIYSVGGILGWFPGLYSTLPYYYKVREYNDFESRDLWSYQLNLKPEEIDQLIRHLWELGQTRYDYRFFTENCSFHIITAIEAAAPRYEITKRLPYWVIPSDTILEAQNAGAIKQISYRPSARNIFIYHFGLLTPQEKKEFYRLRNQHLNQVSVQLDENSQTHVIDVLLDWIDYTFFLEIRDKNSWQYQWQKTLLEERASLPTVDEKPVPEPNIQPQKGHPSARVALSGGRNNGLKQNFQRYHLRYALHDLLDPDGGYPDNTQVEFFNLIMQSRNQFHKFDFYQFDLVDVQNLNPLKEYEKSFSWKLDLGTRTIQKKDCSYCQAIAPTGGIGGAVDLFKIATFYILAQGGPFYSNDFDHNEKLRFKVGPEVGILFKPLDNLKAIANYDWYYDLVRKNEIYKVNLSIRKSFGNRAALGANSSIENGVSEYSFDVFYYF